MKFEYTTLNYRREVGYDGTTERSIMDIANDWARGGWRLIQVLESDAILVFEREDVPGRA